MLEILLDVYNIFAELVKEGLPLSYLYSLLGLPFLLLLSELAIRKILHQPFLTKKEVIQTFGYIIIGVVIFIAFLLLTIEFVKSIPLLSVDWRTEDVILVGIVTLVQFALLSPITTLYIYIKSKTLQITYLSGNSIFFCFLVGWLAMYFNDNLQIPIYLYIVLGFVYILYVILIKKANDLEKGISKRNLNVVKEQ